jgi:hypothetical protein
MRESPGYLAREYGNFVRSGTPDARSSQERDATNDTNVFVRILAVSLTMQPRPPRTRAARSAATYRSCALQLFLCVVQTLRLLLSRGKRKLRPMDYMRSCSMNTMKFVAILAALLLTSVEVLVIDYDARQRAVQYHAEAEAAQHG